MNNEEQNKGQNVYNISQNEIQELKQNIQSIKDIQIKHKNEINDQILALNLHFNERLKLIQHFAQIPIEKNKQLKIQSQDEEMRIMIKNEIKQQLEFDFEAQCTRNIEKYLSIHKYKEEIGQLKDNIDNVKTKMVEMEKKIQQTQNLDVKYKDLEKKINKLQLLETKLEKFEQKINDNQTQFQPQLNELIQKQISGINPDLISLKEKINQTSKDQSELQERLQQIDRKSNEKYQQVNQELQEKLQQLERTSDEKYSQINHELQERLQKLEGKSDEKYQQINHLVDVQKQQQQNIHDLKNQTSISQDQFSNSATKNFQNERFTELEKQVEENQSQLNKQFNDLVQKQQNFYNLSNHVSDLALKQMEINNKLEQIEKEINSHKDIINKINCFDQGQLGNNDKNKELLKKQTVNQNQFLNNPTQNQPSIFVQTNQTGMFPQQQNQQFKIPANFQNQNKDQPNFQAEQQSNNFQLKPGNQRFNQTITPTQLQQQQAQPFHPIQQGQLITIQNGLFPNQCGQLTIQPKYPTSMIQIKHSDNSPFPQNQEANLSLKKQYEIQLFQKDVNRCQLSQKIINIIYDHTTRKRSAVGDYLNFIRELEDYQQLCKHYGIKNMQQKRTLKEICNAFRQVRGDGNCFYTAFGFQVIQILIREYSPQDFKQLVDKLNGKFKCQIQLENEKFSGDEIHNSFYDEFLFRLQEFRKIENIEDRINLFIQHFQAYEIQNGIDGCLYGLSTIFFRNLAYYVVDISQQKDMIDDQQALLKWETECNSNEVVIKLLAEYLNINIKLLFFDKGDFLQREYSENSKLSILLLIQPGHYNIGLKIP